MDVFEYVAVLTSIIIGLSMAHVLRGLTQFIQQPKQSGLFFAHIFWAIYMFLMTIFWWWWEFQLATMPTWTFGIYLYVILYAVLIFVLCSLLFPESLTGFDGYKGYFLAKRTWFFAVFMLMNAIDFGDTLLKGMDYLYSLGIEYPVSIGTQLVLSIIAITTRNEKFHNTFAAALVAYLFLQAFRFYGTAG